MHRQTAEFRYFGGLVHEQGSLTREINHRSKAAWACFKRYETELFDRPGAPFRLKARLLKAEAVEAAQARHPPADVIRPGAAEGRLPERTIRQRRLFFAGAVARQPDGRLPKRLMFGELAGGENPEKGSPEQNWLTCLKDCLLYTSPSPRDKRQSRMPSSA